MRYLGSRQLAGAERRVERIHRFTNMGQVGSAGIGLMVASGGTLCAVLLAARLAYLLTCLPAHLPCECPPPARTQIHAFLDERWLTAVQGAFNDIEGGQQLADELAQALEEQEAAAEA